LQLFDLELIDSHYYIKRNTIVERLTFNNRTFYAKFERIDEPLTPLLIQQHLNREYTIATPLLENGYTNYLVIEYKGEECRAFYHLLKHLLHTLKITQYHTYQGKDEQRVQCFICVNHLELQEAHERLALLSQMLQTKLPQKWKCLPDATLPDSYNIITLPYLPL